MKKGRLVLVITAMVLALGTAWVLSRESGQSTVSLPVLKQSAEELTPLEAWRGRKTTQRKEDMAALQALLDNKDADEAAKEDAAALLTRLVQWNEEETALEGALLNGGISPGAVIRSEGAVTIVTEKSALSDGERALLLTMAQTHTDVPPEGVRVETLSAE